MVIAVEPGKRHDQFHRAIGSTRQFAYNDNGYPTDVFDAVGDHTTLSYQNVERHLDPLEPGQGPTAPAVRFRS